MDNKKSKEIVVWIASFIIVLGVTLMFTNYAKSMRVKSYSFINLKIEEDNGTTQATKNQEPAEKAEDFVEQFPDDKKNENAVPARNNYYVGYLEIPKINFRKGFLPINHRENNVEQNLQVIPSSSYPDVDKGNFIIAGHSGIGYKAFFKYLYKVVVGDQVYVYYQGYRYTYKIEKIYKQLKTGTIGIHRNYEVTTLTLVTCTLNDNQTQTVYIAELQAVNPLE